MNFLKGFFLVLKRNVKLWKIILLQRELSLLVNPPNFEVGHDYSLRSVPLCLFSPLDGDVMQSARVGLGGGWGGP